jgi:hypothetical protein
MRFVLSLVAVVLMVPSGLAAFNDWPQAGFDQTHQGLVPTILNAELMPFQSKWWNNLSIPGPVSSPTVREDIVYFGDASGKVWAIDRESGGIIWTNTTASARVSGTAIGQDFVYVLSEAGGLYSFNRKTGRLENGYPLSVGASFGAPMLHEDIIYVGSTDGTVKSYFVSTRQMRWSFSTAVTFTSPSPYGNVTCPTGSVDGTPVLYDQWVMFGATNKCFFAIKKSAFGTIDSTNTNSVTRDLVWIFKAKDSIRTTPVVDMVNKRVIFGDVGGSMYSVSILSTNTATAAWTYDEPLTAGLSSEFKASPIVVNDKVIVGARNGNVRALSISGGTSMWVRNVNGEVVGSPAAANGHVLVGSFDRNMYMLNATDGAIRDQRLGLAEITTWAAISGTQGFWGDRLGNLYSWGGTKPTRPDLVITSLSGSFTATLPGTISFTVKNQGVLPASNTTALLFAGSTKIAELNVPAIEPGKEYSGSYSYTATSPPKIKVTLFVDATRQLKESDEANNEKIVDLAVADAPVPEDPSTQTSSSAGGPAPTGALLICAVLAGAFLVSRRRRHA